MQTLEGGFSPRGMLGPTLSTHSTHTKHIVLHKAQQRGERGASDWAGRLFGANQRRERRRDAVAIDRLERWERIAMSMSRRATRRKEGHVNGQRKRENEEPRMKRYDKSGQG